MACPRKKKSRNAWLNEDNWENKCCNGCPWKHSKRCRRRNHKAAELVEELWYQDQATPVFPIYQLAEGGGEEVTGTLQTEEQFPTEE